jgi:multiple sugar transport system permease protein
LAATPLIQTQPTVYKRKRLRWLDVKEHLTGYLFILPAFAIIALFGFFPIAYSLYMSLYNWRVRQGDFVGLANYTKLVGNWNGLIVFTLGMAALVAAYLVWERAGKATSTWRMLGWMAAAVILIGAGFAIPLGWGNMLASGDKNFLNSLPITLYYAILTVPAELILALGLAYILFQNIRGKEFFRMLYFLPYITPIVAAAVVFRTIFNQRDTSLANQVVTLFGLPLQKWLFEAKPVTQLLGLQLSGFWAGPSLALVSIAILGIWTFVGYNSVIFLAGLGSIPTELYEAAEIDGANHWDLFRHITVPLLSPITFYLAIIGFIGTFKAFNHIYVMRTPFAQNSVNVASVNIFEVFYQYNQYGYAAAQAILLLMIILFLTFVQNKIFGEKVFYG